MLAFVQCRPIDSQQVTAKAIPATTSRTLRMCDALPRRKKRAVRMWIIDTPSVTDDPTALQGLKGEDDRQKVEAEGEPSRALVRAAG